MALIPESKSSKVNGITNEQRDLALSFIQGAVYCWCKNRKNECFALRDLFGGDNYSWNETALMPLYQKHVKKGSADPVKEAGIDAGWLLKTVLVNDKRSFSIEKKLMVNHYKWLYDKDTK